MKPTPAQIAAGHAACNAAGLNCDEATVRVPARQPPKAVSTLKSAEEITGDLEAAMTRNGKKLSPEHRKAYSQLMHDILAPQFEDDEEDEETDDEEIEADDEEAPKDIVSMSVAEAMQRFKEQKDASSADVLKRFGELRADKARPVGDSAPRTGYVDMGALFPGGLPGGDGPLLRQSAPRVANDRAPAPQPVRQTAAGLSGQAVSNAIPALGLIAVHDPARPVAARIAPRVASADAGQQAMRREFRGR